MAATVTTTEIKDLSHEMEQGYQPRTVESGWFPWWEGSGFFKPKDENKDNDKKYVIVIPPPNVTGRLHLGHALTAAVQDTLVRYHRMAGYDTLYVPGTDHAGIATQVVVEKRLKKEENKSRHDYGREAFLEKVWEWKDTHCGAIQQQFRRVGLSADWSRERFTMDSQCAKAVNEAFVTMHEDGKVYRATRLINWCCTLQSAISDLEVDTELVEKNAKVAVPGYSKKVDMGQLTQVAYKVKGTNEELIVATTRPETILGDVAVAIHPNDKRYTHLHGKTLQCPFRDEEIPIVLDPELVDMEFGTGAVKITPAHDRNDFSAGQRHNLPSIVVFDLKGNIAMPGQFEGMYRFEARKQIVAELEKLGLLREVVPYEYRIAKCGRTGDIVEPMLLPQWFVDCTSMAKASVEAVKNKELKLEPETHESTWNHFLNNIEPWCVSRQLWWGHRIPAYEVKREDGSTVAEDAWVVARNLDEAKAKAKEKFNVSDSDIEKLSFNQDEDVLDTWFSSGLWPISTLGWPNETTDFARFFPTSLLETGHDIIFFWVARMVMMSLHLTGKLPFTEVYLHAMVRDREGRKMSKNLGNVIDPLDVIDGISLQALHDSLKTGNLDPKELPRAEKFQKESFPDGIPECGSDALRFGLLSYTQSGRNVNLDIQRIVGYRQFCNKLWNVVRYVLYFALEPGYKPKTAKFESTEGMPLECKWILSRLDTAIGECNRSFTQGSYDFATSTQSAYRFWLYELCDVFLELTKTYKSLSETDEKRILVNDVLLYCVETGLRMLHPMMPFVTEELWHRLPHWTTLGQPSIMLMPYPTSLGFTSAEVEAEMKELQELLHAGRSMKSSYGLTAKQRPESWVSCSQSTLESLIKEHTYIVESLASLGAVTVISDKQVDTVPAGCGVSVVSKDLTLHLMLKGLIDVQKEVDKLNKNRAGIAKQIEGIKKKQALANYETKVPENVRKADAEKLDTLETQTKQIDENISKMESMK